jgi:hypothetical protein
MYRYGTTARPMFKEIDKISEKWTKNNIQCRVPKHGRTNDGELSYKYTQSMRISYLSVIVGLTGNLFPSSSTLFGCRFITSYGSSPATRANSESISLLSCEDDLTEYSIISPKVFSLNFGIPRKLQSQSRSMEISLSSAIAEDNRIRRRVPADRDRARLLNSLWRLRHNTAIAAPSVMR